MGIATLKTDSARTLQTFKNLKLYKTILGDNQIYLTASITSNDEQIQKTAVDAYSELAKIISEKGFKIIHERIFGSLVYENVITSTRRHIFEKSGIETNTPFTFVQGAPIDGPGLAGVQIRAFAPSAPGDYIQTIFENENPVGRKWSRNGAAFIMLQNIFGRLTQQDRYHQACDMFDRAQSLLHSQGIEFCNVVRTWIYLSNILDWYGEFNRARNARFAEFGLLGLTEKENREAEQIFLPASTGILGENPLGAVATMDLLALPPNQDNIHIAHTSGLEQKSPYRYGSAFSRAMTLKESDVTHILLSGTASIDEHGKTVYLDDAAEQIRKTMAVIQSLISAEGATLKHINEATVFFKDAADFTFYNQIIKEFADIDLPAIFIVADVCRDDLLFEMDAAIAF